VLSRRFVSGLGVAVSLAVLQCLAGLVGPPNTDVLYPPPATQNTAEAALTRSFLREGSNGPVSKDRVYSVTASTSLGIETGAG
jgi:hypothetical protein